MNKLLVTGCAGFIGSHLAEKLLNENYIVYGFDNFDAFYPRVEKEKNIASLLNHKNFTFLEGDICSVADLNKLPAGIDLIIHLASKAGVRPSIKDPVDYIHTNIIGTQNLLNWANSRNIKKFVFASSSSIYGNNAKTPFSETHNVDNPISPYAFTKKSCELLNYTYHHLYNIDVVNLRFFTVYGPRQRPDLAIRKFVGLIKNNDPLPLFGDGKTGRDYTFITDIVDGITATINYLKSNSGVYEIINLGNNNPVLLNELVDYLYELLKQQPNIEWLPIQQGDVNITFADISKAQKLLGYSPKISIKDGLRKFIEWDETN